MFIEPMITWVPSGFLGTYGLIQKLCLKKEEKKNVWLHLSFLIFHGSLIGYIILLLPEVVL